MPPQQSPHFPDSFFRVATKGLLVRDEKVLLSLCTVTRDGKEVDIWELPGGGLDFGETPHQGLTRELFEEGSMVPSIIAPLPTYIWTYHIQSGARGLPWFYALLMCYRFETESLAIVPTEECKEVRFFTHAELCALPNLSKQLHQLRDLFNPADFTEPIR
jgi:8-oxo-dGTP pyrophosphatase MutT (NUDIX family)